MSGISGQRFLVLGGGTGWHSDQLRGAADAADCELSFASYESITAGIDAAGQSTLACESGGFRDFDAILTRTMPPGSLEKITFRLATLHAYAAAGLPIINPPRSLEIAIDKFATLQHIGGLGYPVPATRVVQSRAEAIDAFRELGGDCIVKPLFGGEGRGVMRIRDAELAWYTFSTLDQLDAVFYVQRFVPPGGRDTRILVVGDETIAVRRESADDFRTNVSSGAKCIVADIPDEHLKMARHVCQSIGLPFAAVDLLDSDEHEGGACVLEVNAVPGWRGAQNVIEPNIAGMIIRLLQQYSGNPGLIREGSLA